MKIKKKLVSSILLFAMIFSMLSGVISPLALEEVEAASTDSLPNVKIYAEKSKKELEQLSGRGLNTLKENQKKEWVIELWHFSSGYWGNSKITILDSEWKKTQGGVADLKTALKLDYQTFTYDIPKGSELHQSIENGEDVVININSGLDGKKLTSFYDMEEDFDKKTEETKIATKPDGTIKDATANIVKNSNGTYSINIKIKPKLNYYREDELSYFLHFGLPLNKWIPFIRDGFGYQVYSMFGPGLSEGWTKGMSGINPQNCNDLSNIEAGALHPAMIKSVNGHLKPGYKIKSTYNQKGGIYNSENIRIGDYTFKDAGAVGLHFVFPVNLSIYTVPQAKVVKTFVKVAGVDSNGKLIYEEIAEPEIGPVDYWEGSQNVRIEPLVTTPYGTGILNDVITSPKQLEPIEQVKWLQGTPKTNQVEIKPVATDISRYAFGIVSEEEEVVDTAVDKQNAGQVMMMMLFAAYGLEWKSIKPTEVIDAEPIDNIYEVPLKGNIESQNTPVVVATNNETITNKGSENTIRIENKQSGVNRKILDASVVYLRYIVVPESRQINKINIKVDGVLMETAFIENRLPILEDPSGGYETTTELLDLSEKIKGLNLIEWYTSDANPIQHDPFPPKMSSGGFSGSGPTPVMITGLSTDQNVYATWEIEMWSPGNTPMEDTVPEWRLSKYKEELPEWRQAFMNLNLRADNGHTTSTLSPSGTYNYYTINPNGKRTETNNNPDNMKHLPWLHSKTLTKGNYTISHDKTYNFVDVTGNLNLIKSNDIAGIKVASWKTDQATKNRLTKYNINSDQKGAVFNKDSYISEEKVVEYGIENKDTYTHNYGVYYHYDCWHTDDEGGSWSHDVCACYTLPETPSTTYDAARFRIIGNFERYKPKDTKANILTVSPTKNESNGKTTLSIQENTELKVYPEVPMLFENDRGDETVVFAVGDYARSIKPVTFHSLEYKAFVEPKTVGLSVATDSRAKVSANQAGVGKNPIIYKGAGANTTFKVSDKEGSNNSGQLVVKTYALDISNNSLKTSWGNSGYNTRNIHNNFLNKWTFAGKSTSKLEILQLTGALAYDGASNIKDIKLNKSTKTVSDKSHTLVVRGGVVTHVNGVTVASLKSSNPDLYEALKGMKLIGANKDSTVFKTFEHQVGKPLTEQNFVNLAKGVRNGINNLQVGKGWYSEDSTVLKVVEHTTVYNLPNTMSADKIPMAVKGLETPINKQLFFNKIFRGHNYLRYEMSSGNISGLGVVSSYFETSSKEVDAFSKKTVDYGVPNVSITDTLGFN